MTLTIKNIIIDAKHQLGAELLRSRLLSGKSREEVCETFNLYSPLHLQRIEEGKIKHVFLALKLMKFYGKKIQMTLID